jgi:hypothetical protein
MVMNPQKGLLGDVLGRGGITQHLPAARVNGRSEPGVRPVEVEGDACLANR